MGYVPPRANFNIYKISNIPEGVIKELLPLCFTHPEGIEFKLIESSEEETSSTGETTSVNFFKINGLADGEVYHHPNNLLNSNYASKYRRWNSWTSPCFVAYAMTRVGTAAQLESDREKGLNLFYII